MLAMFRFLKLLDYHFPFPSLFPSSTNGEKKKKKEKTEKWRRIDEKNPDFLNRILF